MVSQSYLSSKKPVSNDLQGQRDWGSDRAHWSDLLNQYESGDAYHRTQKPGLWITPDGCVVLDNKSTPIIAFPELPDTISSKADGAFLIAWRRSNKHIRMQDIRARMPNDPTGNNTGRDGIRLGTLGMRMTRFRERYGLISWDKREGSEALKAYLDDNLPLMCIHQNSIEGHRNPHPHEIAEMALIGMGQNPERSRHGTDFSASDRAKAYNKALAKYRNLKAKFDRENGNQDDQDIHGEAQPMDSENDVSSSNSVDDHDEDNTEEDSIEEGDTEEGDTEDGDTEDGDSNNGEEPTNALHLASSQMSDEEVALAEEGLAVSANLEDLPNLPANSPPGINETEVELGWDNRLIAEGGDTTGGLEESGVDAVTDHETWFLYAAAETEVHRLLVYHLLEPTREEYRLRTFQDAPPTDLASSYVDQWAPIQRAFSQSNVGFEDQFRDPFLISVIACSPRRIMWSKVPLVEINFDDLLQAVFG